VKGSTGVFRQFALEGQQLDEMAPRSSDRR
jgi:hypothetical protein